MFSIFDKGKIYTDSLSVATMFNYYFVSLGKKLLKAFLVPVCGVLHNLSKLKTNKVTELDKLIC